MKRPLVPVVAIVLTVALVGLLVYGITAKGGDSTLDDAVKSGKTPVAPGATMQRPNLEGDGSTSLASLRGKVVVLNFWASWCPPCVAESPILERVQQKLAKDGTGTVLGATYNDTTTDAKRFMQEHRLTYPTVQDIGTDLARKYGTDKLPETFVIDGKGRIVAISRGQIEDEAFLTRAIDKATRTAQTPADTR
jgi:cytochrome c biogenesis protein CcmG/thiol:disulfide interchange protein DsbE